MKDNENQRFSESLGNPKGFQRELITKSTSVDKILRLGVDCSRCGHCCRYGSGFLVPEDIPRIAKKFKLTKEELIKNCLEPVAKFNTTLHRPVTVKNGKKYGTCIFFNTQLGCTIHDVKPLHCKISSCNEYGEEISVWFHLNYFVNPNDPQSIREWKLYLDSGGKNIPGGTLQELVPNKEKLRKILSYEVLK